MNRRTAIASLLSAAVAGAAVCAPLAEAVAGNHNDVRRDIKSGNALPLSQILGRIRRQFPGKLMDAGYNRNRGTYKLRIMSPDGRMQSIIVDARSGRILGRGR